MLLDIYEFIIASHSDLASSPSVSPNQGETTKVRDGFVWTQDENVPSGVYLIKATVFKQGTSVPCVKSAMKRVVYMK